MRVLIFIALILISPEISDSRPTMAEYLRVIRRMIFVPNSLRELTPMVFDQRHGEYNRGFFETFHGTRGQMLIDMYGQGLSREQLRKHGLLR